ncbi:MAG: hypothetical protein WC763_06375 [Candidatus Paceibacterota bacterium]|jgi:hypothetical protein
MELLPLEVGIRIVEYAGLSYPICAASGVNTAQVVDAIDAVARTNREMRRWLAASTIPVTLLMRTYAALNAANYIGTIQLARAIVLILSKQCQCQRVCECEYEYDASALLAGAHYVAAVAWSKLNGYAQATRMRAVAHNHLSAQLRQQRQQRRRLARDDAPAAAAAAVHRMQALRDEISAFDPAHFQYRQELSASTTRIFNLYRQKLSVSTRIFNLVTACLNPSADADVGMPLRHFLAMYECEHSHDNRHSHHIVVEARMMYDRLRVANETAQAQVDRIWQLRVEDGGGDNGDEEEDDDAMRDDAIVADEQLLNTMALVEERCTIMLNTNPHPVNTEIFSLLSQCAATPSLRAHHVAMHLTHTTPITSSLIFTAAKQLIFEERLVSAARDLMGHQLRQLMDEDGDNEDGNDHHRHMAGRSISDMVCAAQCARMAAVACIHLGSFEEARANYSLFANLDMGVRARCRVIRTPETTTRTRAARTRTITTTTETFLPLLLYPPPDDDGDTDDEGEEDQQKEEEEEEQQQESGGEGHTDGEQEDDDATTQELLYDESVCSRMSVDDEAALVLERYIDATLEAFAVNPPPPLREDDDSACSSSKAVVRATTVERGETTTTTTTNNNNNNNTNNDNNNKRRRRVCTDRIDDKVVRMVALLCDDSSDESSLPDLILDRHSMLMLNRDEAEYVLLSVGHMFMGCRQALALVKDRDWHDERQRVCLREIIAVDA